MCVLSKVGPVLPKLLSVGIPTFNRPEELRRTLEQITSQTYDNLEIIVSDNASDDKVVCKILEEFAARDSRVRFFIQEHNRGPAHNFQFVLDKANGEYFMWSGDDDWHHEEFIEELVKAMESTPDAVVAFCDFQETLESGARASGYPDHLPVLKPFTSKSKYYRCIRYFMQNNIKGKENMYYGIYRTKVLKETNILALEKQYGKYGLGVLFVYKCLLKGRLALVDRLLYRNTVGNTKHYKTQEIDTKEFFLLKKIRSLMILQRISVLFNYPMNSPFPLDVVLLLLLPARAFLELTYVAALISLNFYKKVKHRIKKYV